MRCFRFDGHSSPARQRRNAWRLAKHGLVRALKSYIVESGCARHEEFADEFGSEDIVQSGSSCNVSQCMAGQPTQITNDVTMPHVPAGPLPLTRAMDRHASGVHPGPKVTSLVLDAGIVGQSLSASITSDSVSASKAVHEAGQCPVVGSHVSGQTSIRFADLPVAAAFLQQLVRRSEAFHTETNHEPRHVQNQPHLRDLYPLPSLLAAHLQEDDKIACSPCILQVLIDFANIGIAALNRLYGTDVVGVIRPNAAQLSCLRRAFCKTRRMYERLARVATEVPDHRAALRSLADLKAPDEKQSNPAPRMCANSFDMLHASGGCDPMPYIDETNRDIIVAGFFQRPPDGLAKFATVCTGDLDEYAALVVRQLRSRKVELRAHVRGGGAVFAVGKRDSAKLRLREVWHGARVSDCALPPPAPPCLAGPTALLDLESSIERPLFMSKRDGRCLFDQLSAPWHLRGFFGRPAVKLQAIIDQGMTLDEIKEHVVGGQPVTSTSWL